MIFSPKRNPKTKWESSSANRPRDGLMIPILSSGFASARKSRSEEHTSELQSHLNLVCRLLLEKKKNKRERQPPSRSTCARHHQRGAAGRRSWTQPGRPALPRQSKQRGEYNHLTGWPTCTSEVM